eukprot:s1518_g10.t1
MEAFTKWRTSRFRFETYRTPFNPLEKTRLSQRGSSRLGVLFLGHLSCVSPDLDHRFWLRGEDAQNMQNMQGYLQVMLKNSFESLLCASLGT